VFRFLGLQCHEPLIDKRTSGSDEKKTVARLALECIDDGDTIILDVGTTIVELARILNKKRDITVVTNDLTIASILEPFDGVQVVIIGGILRSGFHCTINHGTASLLNSITVDKAFMGANSFSLKRGASAPDLSQAEMKKQMISVASKVFILCDHTKLETNSFMNFASLKETDLLITDRIPENFKDSYEIADLEFITS